MALRPMWVCGLALLVVAGLAGLVHVLLNRSLWGRWLYAVGQNARAALISGVPVGGVTVSLDDVNGVYASQSGVTASNGDHIFLDSVRAGRWGLDADSAGAAGHRRRGR